MTDLNEYIDQAVGKPGVSRGLAAVLSDISAACREISKAIDMSALTGARGNQGERNVQGEEQKKLDVISNELFLEHVQRSGLVAGQVSEEMEQPYIPSRQQSGSTESYLVLFDPLDGSSNVDANITVGTIFSVLPFPENDTVPDVESFLQPGDAQLCSGYAIYGPSTMLVLTLGNGVNGFTLDRASGKFLLTHPDMHVPADTQEFAINLSNYRFWESPMQQYIDDCLQGKEGRRGKDFNMRWIASMVAEIHRILLRGGVFLYPVDSKIRKQGGRLRLMYEVNPMAFIVEQAGGQASTGRHRIMEVQPEAPHQRVPIVMGSANEVETIASYYKR